MNSCYHPLNLIERLVSELEKLRWISVKERPPPPMQTVQLCVGGKVIVGWNESVQPEEDPSYCSWENWPDEFISGEGVTHWAPLLKPPRENE